MKAFRYLLILIIISFLLISLNVNSAFVIKKKDELINAYNNQNLIRLHVVANSNSPYDQYLKRKVRDKIVDYMAGYPDNNWFLSDLSRIEKLVEELLKEEGEYLPVEVQFGNFYFPRRTYGNLTLPAGEYKALKIILGKGEGSNWWCVLTPPLCIDEAREIAPESPKIEFRFRLVDWLKETFSKGEKKKKIDELDKLIDILDINIDKRRPVGVSFFTSARDLTYNSHVRFPYKGGFMVLKNSELKMKDVIDINRGKKLGYIDDVELELDKGRIKAFIIPAHQVKLLSLFSKKQDIVITWENIKKIGEDVILVDFKGEIEV